MSRYVWLLRQRRPDYIQLSSKLHEFCFYNSLCDWSYNKDYCYGIYRSLTRLFKRCLEYPRFRYSNNWVRQDIYFYLSNVFCRAIELITTYALTKKTKINLKALRNLRVLRPLRTVNAIPSMRRLVATLIGSLNQLMNVAIFIAFLFLLFGVLGL
jgi:hypothetical protein